MGAGSFEDAESLPRGLSAQDHGGIIVYPLGRFQHGDRIRTEEKVISEASVDRWLYLVQFNDGFYSYLNEEPDFARHDKATRFFHMRMGTPYSEVLKFMDAKRPRSKGIREINI